jgi:phosphomethylpyrimidine synthase
MTLIEKLQNKKSDDSIKIIAKKENVTEQFLIDGILKGEIVITKNINREIKKLCAVGKGLKVKVNANIGTSPEHVSIDEEMEKLDAAVSAGADAIMDLSTGGDLKKIRSMILKNCPVPLGTVPIYQAACRTVAKGAGITKIDKEELFRVIEEQAQEGVDFMTLHCGVTKANIKLLKVKKRIAGVVSRGGAFLTKWIEANDKENPLYEEFDRLLEIAKKYDVTISLGDGLRPGCLADASDEAQMAELKTLGELVLRCRKAGVQSIVEGPGHMPLDQIQPHVKLAKELIHNAPYYLLGPLVTDVAAGYDHITGAIGGAIAATAGADFLCYVTPSEHLRLPDKKDVYDGVMASRIAGHAADIVRNPNARKWDDEFSVFRKSLDWEKQEANALDPEKFKVERENKLPRTLKACTMCGDFCSMKEEK